MKKMKFFALAVLACFMFASCNSVDSLIEKYEKACKAGDTVEMSKIAQKLDKKKGDLTAEQTKHLLEAVTSCANEQAEGVMKDFSGKFNEVADDLEDEYDDAMDELEDEYDDAMDELDLD